MFGLGCVQNVGCHQFRERLFEYKSKADKGRFVEDYFNVLVELNEVNAPRLLVKLL